MIDVNLGEKTVDNKDSDINIYECVELAGIPNPEQITGTLIDTIVDLLTDEFGADEKFAVMGEILNFNTHSQTLDLSLEYKGNNISESDLADAIKKAVDTCERIVQQ